MNFIRAVRKSSHYNNHNNIFHFHYLLLSIFLSPYDIHSTSTTPTTNPTNKSK
tara:strand:+ start:5247 stop:5405 length:159 start_codon:yes stop_codon:yes gene_type:complete